MESLPQLTASYIARHSLLSPSETYLVALSGGADSVALLLILQQLGYKIEACHCNFHLRGQESDRDETFCAHLCGQLQIPFHRIHFDTKAYASLHHESIEMAARHLRYHYFESLRQDIGAAGICVAHHQDDSVETVLINLLRGTGIDGLTGIQPRNGHILRPLLCATRQQITAYLSDKGQRYVTDSTNLVPDVVRNKIRLQVLPLLCSITPAAADNIAATASHLSEAAKILHAQTAQVCIEEKDGKLFIDKKEILRQASPEYILFSCLQPYGFSGKRIEEIISSMDVIGKLWKSETHALVIDRQHLILRPADVALPRTLRIPEPGLYTLDDTHRLRVSRYAKGEDFQPMKARYGCTLDASLVTFPLVFRPCQEGDRFRPFGMKGSKLVSDYLTDCKVNYFNKQDTCVVADAHDTIIWLAGHRCSDNCKTTAKTTDILELSIEQA